MRQLLSHDPDQIQMIYATLYRWTPFFRLAASRKVIQTGTRLWDYKHQVLATRHMPPWRVLLWVKLTEVVMQCRPKALYRVLFLRDRGLRRAMRWYTQIGRRVWFHEVWRFLLDRRTKNGPTVAEECGAPRDAEEEVMAVAGPERAVHGKKTAATGTAGVCH